MKTTCYALAALVAISFFQPSLFAQNAADVVVPITITASSAPAITLSWPMPASNTTQVVVDRKAIFETTWTELAQLPNTVTTFTDGSVIVGEPREYRVTLNGPVKRVGLVYAGIDVPARSGPRGKVILVIDDGLATSLATELTRLEADLRGDGWQVIRHNVAVATSTVASVKALLRTDYEADPEHVTAALLFGNLPVPYSGNIAPDGHGDHVGAWPTDYYYGDMDEAFWTDNTVNTTTASRPANDNVPGDGKFDQSQTPTLAELVVSRVDFSRLNGWSVTQTELYRRYLDKNHAFRTGAYQPQQQSLVDDNFGYFGGEAFAQNGWRNGYALTGPNSVQAADFFNDTDNQSFLIGYGTGGGSYTSAGGVGSSDNFKTDSVNIVFSMLFGSYHGDWDYENNPFMPSALASKGGILTCSWAGRPNWHLHHMALGEPIWVSTYWTWLNSFLAPTVYPANFGADLVHVGLLGDPTLRAHAVKPPTNAVAATTCTGVDLIWTASADAALGYYVYRAPAADSIFQLITPSPVLATAFTDNSPLDGANFYQVKSVKRQVVPTGSYFNQSIGAAAQVMFTPAPTASLATTPVSCNGGADGTVVLTVTGGNQPLTFKWSNNANTQQLSGVGAGTYTVTVTDQLMCTVTASATVTQPSVGMTFVTDIIETISCHGAADGILSVTATGATPPYTYLWSNGETSQVINNIGPGLYLVTITDMLGCLGFGSVVFFGQPAVLSLQTTVTNADCHGSATGSVALEANGGTPGYTYAWSNGATTPNLSNLAAGTYSPTVTDNNGCTATTTVTVTQPALLSLQTSVSSASCNGGADGNVTLSVSGGIPGYSFQWSNNTASQHLTNVGAGVYTVTVSDANGCSQTVTATVNESSTLDVQATTTGVSCAGSTDGSVTLMISGGTPGYTLNWSNGAVTQNLTGLAPGDYIGTVSDANNCQQLVLVTVSEPSPLFIDPASTELSCYGGADGELSITVSGGTMPYTYLWSNGATTAQLSGLSSGFYSVTTTDAHGCTATVNFVLTEPPPVNGVVAPVQESCFGAGALLSVESISGGSGGPYTYSVNGGPQLSPLAALLLGPGTYTVRFFDQLNCSTETTVEIVAATLLLPTVVSSPVSCPGSADGAATLTVAGGTPPYTFLWSNGENTQDISGLTAGSYSVTVTDANGCTNGTGTIVTEPLPVTVPIMGTVTACLGFPELYSVPGIFSAYQWAVGNGGTVTLGQGSPEVLVLWETTGPTLVTVYFNDPNGCPDSSVLSVAVDVCLGAPEAPFAALSVLPNPFSDQLMLHYAPGFDPGTTLRVYDVQGRLILTQSLSSSTLTLETAAWPAGAYFLQIINPKEQGVWRVIRQDD